MNDQQQNRADALTDQIDAAMELAHRWATATYHKGLSKPYEDFDEIRKQLRIALRELAASPVEQPALLTAQDALAAIETFEIVGDNNDSREPNAEDRFILTEFVAHLFGGFRVEQPAAPPIVSAPVSDARECLMDVVSHHQDFVTACKSIKGELHACGAHDSAAYWQKQIDVLDRMKAQAERALATSANETSAEGPAIELLRKFMEYRDSDYVPNVLFDCTRTIIDNAMAAAALADETPEGCTPADARMLREANHALATENDALRRTLRPFARVVSTDKLSWAMVEYCVEGDPEKQTFQAPQMQRAFNRAADILRAEPSQPAAAPADERAACTHQWTWADGKCADCGASTKQPTPTGGMTLGERIAHVGGRVKEDGIVEFGSVMALDALVQHVLRDTSAAASPAEEAVALTDEGIIQLFEEKVDVDLEVYHGIAASTVLSFARALLAAPQPAPADAPAEACEPIAWVTDDDRAITAAQKQRALADGGATASSVRPYSIPCYAVSAPADAGEARLTDAARDMLAERRRQVEAEGWTPEHDDQYQHGAIALAAACYAANAGGIAWADPLPSFWPWMHNWWKPTTPRRDLVKAGALILAELERLDRAALLNGADHDQ